MKWGRAALEEKAAALPDAKVVKTLNTAAMLVLTEPAMLPPSSVFVSSDPSPGPGERGEGVSPRDGDDQPRRR